MLSDLAKYIWKLHYQRKDKDGKYLEHSPLNVMDRIGDAYDEYFIDRDKELPENKIITDELIDLMMKRFVSFNSPVFYNLGVQKEPQLAACYVSSLEDSIDSIGITNGKALRIFKNGAGIGIPIWKLRPQGASLQDGGKHIVGDDGSSGGPSFMRLFNVTGEIVKAAGKRRAAIMACHKIDHPDVLDFINIKTGDQREEHLNMNISVMCTDKFMEAVKNDDDWDLVWADRVWKSLKARHLFKTMAEAAWKVGDPGILFYDRINEYNVFGTEYPIEATNPCVPGSTQILTDKGYVTIDNFQGLEVNVWNGKEFSEVTIEKTGTNAELVEVSLSDGTSLKCTPYHKWPIEGEMIEAKDLESGNKLDKFEMPIIDIWQSLVDGKISSYSKPQYTNGFFCGDGYVDSRGRRILWLYGEKKDLVDKLEYKALSQPPSGDRLFMTLNGSGLTYNGSKYSVPEYGSLVDKLSWFAGLCDSDGTVVRNKNGCSLQISSVDKEFLLRVRKMLTTVGCQAKVTRSHKEQLKTMPGGTYQCQDCFRLLLNSTDLKRLQDIGFETYRLDISDNNPNRDARRYVVIEDVKTLDYHEDVYCFTEPKNHTGCFEGIVTGQCGEQALHPDTTCNLGAINLEVLGRRYENLEDESDLTNLFSDIRSLTRTLMPYLNANIDIAGYPTTEFRDNSLHFRNVGLGFMGLGEMLARFRVPYNTKTARHIASKIMEAMTISAYEWSMEASTMAPVFSANEIARDNFRKIMVTMSEKSDAIGVAIDTKHFNTAMLNGITFKDRWKAIIDKIDEGIYPLNSSVTTVAPTGNTGIAFDSGTGGCEPIYSLAHTRRIREGSGERTVVVVDPALSDVLKDNGIKLSPDEIMEKKTADKLGLPKEIADAFITSHEIDWIDRVKMQSELQKFCTSAISSTVNLPNSATIEDVADIYMTAYKLGCKGITVFRDGCGVEGILSRTKKKPELNLEKFERSCVLQGYTMKGSLHGPDGEKNVYITVNEDEGKNPREVFVQVGNAGSVEAAYNQTIGRFISKLLQQGSTVENVVSKLINTRSNEVGWCYLDPSDEKPVNAESVQDLIGKFLRRRYIDNREIIEGTGVKCPKCKRYTFKRTTDGCWECSNPDCEASNCN